MMKSGFKPQQKPQSLTLAAFTMPNARANHRGHLHKSSHQDHVSTVSSSPTTCSSRESSDCGNDQHWEELSTSSSTDRDTDSCTNSVAAVVDTAAMHWYSQSTSAHNKKDASRNQPKPASPVPTPFDEPSWSSAVRGRSHISQPPVMKTNPWMGSQKQSMNSRIDIHPDVKCNKAHKATTLDVQAIRLSTLAGSNSTSSVSFAPQLEPMVQPINIGPPTDYDYRNTNGLMKCANALAPQATPEELSNKHLVINELQRLTDEWMRMTFPEEQQVTTTATLLLGGSWHLKVGLSDSDLDVAALLPSYVTSDLFFRSLSAYLSVTPSVCKLVVMAQASVPVLAFQLNGVRIDLLFARFTQSVVPKNLPIHSDEILSGMDISSIRSLSVPRVASLILDLVPNGTAFRSCLRIIRLWAKRRGIYSNKAGFLGGISWTILVAFVCQMFPKATTSSIVHHFFAVLSTWNWPTPVLISKPYECTIEIDGASSLQWSPQNNRHDRAHLMPIITPGFPAVNTSVNVNESTMRILQEELERGKCILDEMCAKGLSSPAVWHKLFTLSECTVRYDHYLLVELRATSDNDLSEWANYVSSRNRKLVETLEHTPSIRSIHPFPDLIRPISSVADNLQHSGESLADCVGYFVLGFTTEKRCSRVLSEEEFARTSVASPARYFAATELDTSCERKPGMGTTITYRSWDQLPDEIFPRGRRTAAGERARFILNRAHSTHVIESRVFGAM